MSDYTELKRMAEAATQSRGPRRVEVDHNGRNVIGDGSWRILSAWNTPDGKGTQNAEFAAAASPSAVLALIAENERLKTVRSTTERDLAQELEVWKNGPSCWNCGDTGDVHDMVGEWRGQCDCNAAKLIDVSSERDKLKAENEALRREREGKVLCDLELFETLRDAANTEADEHRQCMATYRPLRQANLDSVVKKCDDLLAAMGKGEQS